ncbi:membrane protein [Gemmobacter nanjingensis]|jgi:drug/metabolite transporter (DMT)-like permease|uniref:Membrane protein n=1 Tax=Gemmobacter nanjingensis TaxID=488454 RepID=A0ABQ3FCJ5_9RHOB|nr:DMT family transporter [Gemmobacter nanjingensis]GHC18153.1 membrane protein [Gemmobacter nanjingensis]
MTDNLRGSLFMVAAMLGFAIEDMLLKRVAGAGVPVGEVLMLFGTGGMLAFAALTARAGQALWHPAVVAPRMLWKAGFEVGGRLFYTLAIALTPLSSASAILQATPLVVVAGAALIFGERVGWRRWSAILVGLAGVLLILRPGLEGFSAASLLAVAGLLGFAGRDLATRAAPKVLSNLQLGIYGFAAMVPTGAGLLLWEGGAVVPAALQWAELAGAVCVGVFAYWALTVAMRTGEVSVVTPFRYTRLLFALVLGMVVFHERPDAATLIGSAIVVAAGVFTLLRGRASARG